MTEIRHAAGLAYREAGPADGAPVLMLHGFPESSYMWRALLTAVGDAGWRAIAPDFPGYGDSPADPPGTWERHVEALERFVAELELGPVVLVAHDWGGLIGLRWACDHPGAARALVVAGSGFFADGQWHGLASALREPGTGEQTIELFTPEALGATLQTLSSGIDDAAVGEYAKVLGDPLRRAGVLELYRSGDFEKLEPYAGRLAALGLPALLVWGAKDESAPVAGAQRFVRELDGARLEVLDDAGHFVFEDAPAETSAAVVAFLSGLGE